MRGPFCFYSKFDFRARLSRFVVGQVFTRVWPVDSCCNSFLAARWGIAATHLSIPLWNTSKLRAKLFAFVVCLSKVDNAGRSA